MIMFSNLNEKIKWFIEIKIYFDPKYLKQVFFALLLLRIRKQFVITEFSVCYNQEGSRLKLPKPNQPFLLVLCKREFDITKFVITKFHCKRKTEGKILPKIQTSILPKLISITQYSIILLHTFYWKLKIYIIFFCNKNYY